MPTATSSRLGVDLVPVFRRELAGRRDRLRVGEQGDAQRAGGEGPDVVEANRRHAEVGQRCGDSPDERHVLVAEVERTGHEHSERDRDERGRRSRDERLKDEDERQRADTDDDRPPVRVREVDDDLLDVGEEAVRVDREPEQGGHLPDCDDEPEPDHVTGQHRLREELGDEAEPQQPRQDEDGAREEGEAGREGEVALTVAEREGRDGGGGEHGDPGAGADVDLRLVPRSA